MPVPLEYDRASKQFYDYLGETDRRSMFYRQYPNFVIRPLRRSVRQLYKAFAPYDLSLSGLMVIITFPLACPDPTD